MAQYASQLIGKVAVEGAEKAKSDFKSVGESAEKTESSFKKLRETVARGFEFGTGMQLAQIPGNIFEGLKEQFVDVIKLAMDHQKVEEDTTNTLEHMGKASGQTAQSIADFADKMSRVTAFSADTTQTAENLMLTFANLGKNIFPQATTAALDMSAKLGTDLQTSVIEVGKALNDPIQGMGALTRVGVSFTEQEKAQIKAMEAHNNMAGAQKIVLFELNKQFGGTAETVGKTFAGQLQIAQNKVEDLKIKIGTALLPILTEFLQYFEQHILPRLDDFSKWFQAQGIPKLQQFGDWFQRDGIPLLNQFGQVVGTVVGDLVSFVQWMQQGSPPAQALKDVLLGVGFAVGAVKIAGLAQDIAGMATKATDFVTGAGKNLVAFFTGDLQTAADNAGKSVAEIGTSAEETVAPVQEASAKDVAALDTVGASAKADAADEVAIGTTAEAEVPVVQGAASKMSSALAGVSLALVNIGESSGAAGVQSRLDKSAAQNKFWLQYEWEKINNFSANAGPMPDFSSMTNDQKLAIMNDWQKSHPGQAFPWLKAQGLATGGTNLAGGWYTVGEQGPEKMYVPPGASVLNHQQSMTMEASGSSNAQQPIILSIDGVQFARVMMPYLTNAIRYNVGSVGF